MNVIVQKYMQNFGLETLRKNFGLDEGIIL